MAAPFLLLYYIGFILHTLALQSCLTVITQAIKLEQRHFLKETFKIPFELDFFLFNSQFQIPSNLKKDLG